MKKNLSILFILSFLWSLSQPNIALVIDDSKSMTISNLWSEVQDQSKNLLNSLPDQTKLDLYFYGHTITKHKGFTLPNDNPTISKYIDAKIADGINTKTHSSLDEVLNNPEVPDIVFLFTDGKATAEDPAKYNLRNTITKFTSNNSYLIIVNFDSADVLTKAEIASCSASPNCQYLKDYKFAIIEPKVKILEFNKSVDTLELSFYIYGTDPAKINKLSSGLKLKRTITPASVTSISSSITTEFKSVGGKIDPASKNLIYTDFLNKTLLDDSNDTTTHEIGIIFDNTGFSDVFVTPKRIKATYSILGFCGIDSLCLNQSSFKGRKNIKINNVFDSFNLSGDCNKKYIEFKLTNIDSTQLKLNFQYGEFSYKPNNEGLWKINNSDLRDISDNGNRCSLDVDFLNDQFSWKSIFEFSTPYNIEFKYSHSNLNPSKITFIEDILYDETKSQLRLKKTKSISEWAAFTMFLILATAIIVLICYILFKYSTKKTFHDGLITLCDKQNGNILASISTKNATRVYFGNPIKYNNHTKMEKICGQKDAFHFLNSEEGYYLYVDKIGFSYVLKSSNTPQQTLAIINHNQRHNFNSFTILIN